MQRAYSNIRRWEIKQELFVIEDELESLSKSPEEFNLVHALSRYFIEKKSLKEEMLELQRDDPTSQYALEKAILDWEMSNDEYEFNS